MKLADVKVGAAVTVTRGYARRPAVVTGIRDGRVSVSFTDVDRGDVSIPEGNRSGLYGAVVLPRSIS